MYVQHRIRDVFRVPAWPYAPFDLQKDVQTADTGTYQARIDLLRVYGHVVLGEVSSDVVFVEDVGLSEDWLFRLIYRQGEGAVRSRAGYHGSDWLVTTSCHQ